MLCLFPDLFELDIIHKIEEHGGPKFLKGFAEKHEKSLANNCIGFQNVPPYTDVYTMQQHFYIGAITLVFIPIHLLE